MLNSRATRRNHPPPGSTAPEIVLLSKRTLGRPLLSGPGSKRRSSARSGRGFSPGTGLEWTRGDHANAQSVNILRGWARGELETELGELQTISSMRPDSLEHQVAMKKQWVKNSLRGKYRLYVQKHFSAAVPGLRQRLVAGSLAAHRSGSICEYPACKRTFSNGECKISFEPKEWSEPMEEASGSESEQAENGPQTPGVENGEGVGNMHCSHLAGAGAGEKTPRFPDYAELMTDSNIELYGKGEFYCLTCFELLLEPIQKSDGLAPPAGRCGQTAPNPKKRGIPSETFIRPSPVCRIYDRVFAETRVHPEGRFVLDDESCEIIRLWKEAQYRAGISKIKAKHGGLFRHGTEAVADENLTGFEKGMGIAECLALVAGKKRRN